MKRSCRAGGGLSLLLLLVAQIRSARPNIGASRNRNNQPYFTNEDQLISVDKSRTDSFSQTYSQDLDDEFLSQLNQPKASEAKKSDKVVAGPKKIPPNMENRLIAHIFDGYDTKTRPVIDYIVVLKFWLIQGFLAYQLA